MRSAVKNVLANSDDATSIRAEYVIVLADGFDEKGITAIESTMASLRPAYVRKYAAAGPGPYVGVDEFGNPGIPVLPDYPLDLKVQSFVRFIILPHVPGEAHPIQQAIVADPLSLYLGQCYENGVGICAIGTGVPRLLDQLIEPPASFRSGLTISIDPDPDWITHYQPPFVGAISPGPQTVHPPSGSGGPQNPPVITARTIEAALPHPSFVSNGILTVYRPVDKRAQHGAANIVDLVKSAKIQDLGAGKQYEADG